MKYKARLASTVVALSFLMTAFMPGIAFAGTFHTVTFAENAGPSDTKTAYQTVDHPTNLTGLGLLSPTFQNPGFTFAGWNTSPDGSGTSYEDGGLYDFASSILLYAIWQHSYFTVTFAQNQNLSDSVIATQTSNSPTALTQFSKLNPTFSNPNQTFVAWNTASDGSGQSYADGAVYPFSGSIVLFAIWSGLPAFSISFDSNGARGSLDPLHQELGKSVTLPNADLLSRQGFQFIGWCADSSGSGNVISAGGSISVSKDTTLYAIWQQSPSTYLVSFNPHGGTVSPSSVAYMSNGTSVVLPGPANGDQVFLGWFTSATGGTFIGGSGSTYATTQDVTLYAHWGSPPSSYQVAFAAGGGSTPVVASSYQVGGALVVLPTASWAGHLFVGWYDNATAGNLVGVAGQTFAPTQNTTLYAHWVEIPADRQYGYVRGFAKNSAKPSNVTKNQVMALARAVKNRHASLVTLWGFTARVGSASHSIGISRQRAAEVRALLIKDLKKIRAGTVTVHSAGQGIWPISGSRDANCVEVFFR